MLLPYPLGNTIIGGRDLYIPPLVEGMIDQARLTDQVTFFVNGNAYYGLQEHLHWYAKNKEWYVFDNHNHAFHYRARHRMGQEDFLLIHIDQHSDMKDPEMRFDEYIKKTNDERGKMKDKGGYWYYANEVLQVGNFISPAIQIGMIATMIQVRSEWKLTHIVEDELFTSWKGKIIVDIDLDFRDPQMSLDRIQTMKNTKKILTDPRVQLVTIATSPYFLDQELALDIAKELVY